MVRVCSNVYPPEKNELYKEYFERYKYPLHDFQKHSIEAIVNGHHVLITAATGSGKTLSGEFAIEHFVKKGKKVIYTSPIKALSNEKFYNFTNKYPHISFGVITGDLTCNPDADVLIMTTEVLLNKLYQIHSKTQPIESTTSASMPDNNNTSFDMNIEKELACVVYDECHYINDQHRGHVWEQSLMMLPYHVQLVLLSATIDSPERFAKWIEMRGFQSPANMISNPITNKEKKIVYLASNTKRAVPLTHYSFITVSNDYFKKIKDKKLESQIREAIDKPIVLQNEKGEFSESNYSKITKALHEFRDKNVAVRRSHVMNVLCKYLFENKMLPALCFLFSRKQIEICARELTTPILEDDSKISYTIHKECEHIIKKLPNYKEYLKLPEYKNMIALLRKGIAVHHSGILPPLREMVEILFSKGFIKILFCSETLSVGINMPVKTVIFTDVVKYDGDSNRGIYSHEYTQMAGRAGRLGLDTVGHVIHLNNIFRNMNYTDYRVMLKGKPQSLVSKFKISFNLLLNLIDIGDSQFLDFTNKSMIQTDITKNVKQYAMDISKKSDALKEYSAKINDIAIPIPFIEYYVDMRFKCKFAGQKTQEVLNKKMNKIKAIYQTVDADGDIYDTYITKQNEMNRLETQLSTTEKYLDTNVLTILNIMEREEFIVKKENNIFDLTNRGIIAKQLKEVHCLTFGNMIHDKILENMTAIQLVGLFSCFTSIYVQEDYADLTPKSNDKVVCDSATIANSQYKKYEAMEKRERLNTGMDYTIHFDLIEYVMEWSLCSNYEECNALIKKIELEKNIFLGEFVKAILKINNISNEMEKIAELLHDIPFLSKLREIKYLTLKYVVTNQSLYV